MSTVKAIDRRNQTMGSLKQMLESLANPSLSEQYCERCGFLMRYVSARFWLEDFDKSWDIPLPYCANCNPEMGNQRSFAV